MRGVGHGRASESESSKRHVAKMCHSSLLLEDETQNRRNESASTYVENSLQHMNVPVLEAWPSDPGLMVFGGPIWPHTGAEVVRLSVSTKKKRKCLSHRSKRTGEMGKSVIKFYHASNLP